MFRVCCRDPRFTLRGPWAGGLAPVTSGTCYVRYRSNIVSRLTRKNWRRKAAGRAKDGRFLYVMVRLGEENRWEKSETILRPKLHLGLPEDRSLNADFDKLTDALAYANGEDGAALASSTHMASADQIPEDRGADIYVSGFTGQGKEIGAIISHSDYPPRFKDFHVTD